MEDCLETIVILGGSYDAWMCAAQMALELNVKKNEGLRIILIEDPASAQPLPSEGSVVQNKVFLSDIGLIEQEWMLRCNATFKLGTRFAGFSGRTKGNEKDSWTLPVDRRKTLSINGLSPLDCWWGLYMEKGESPFPLDLVSQHFLINRMKGPRTWEDKRAFFGETAYAYHFDPLKYAELLSRHAISLGVEQVLDVVRDVKIDSEGEIASLVTRSSGEIAADFFVDCSGAQGTLIRQALSEPLVSYEEQLFCDRILSANSSHSAINEGLEPYTTMHAMRSGWAWEIPLFSTRNLAYVYSSKHISDEEAEKEYHHFFGAKASSSFLHLKKFTSGRLRNSWVKNCVAIGASSGVIDPITSCAMYQVQLGIRSFLDSFPKKKVDTFLVREFNQKIQHLHDSIRNFTVALYLSSGRKKSEFWRDCKKVKGVPFSVSEILKRWDYGILRGEAKALFKTGDIDSLFDSDAYHYLFTGMRMRPKNLPGVLDYCDLRDAAKHIMDFQKRQADLTRHFPGHVQYLLKMRSQMESHVESYEANPLTYL